MRRRTKEPEFNVWREVWPKDTRDGEFVFLARAVEAVGKYLFPTEWTDSDPLGTGDALKRFEEVQEWIAGGIARKQLQFVLITPRGTLRRAREQEGGFGEFGAEEWNVADVSPRFQTCQMPGSRYHSPEAALPPDWIYIHRQTLARHMSGPIEMSAKAPARAAVERWFIESIVAPWRADPIPEKRIGTREALAMAQEKFPTLSKPVFTDIWNANRPQEWAKPGPRKSAG